MAAIHVLDTVTIDQIAAGEVIERPVSVVKELVENALDAGADRITVEITNGGIDLIRVSDNGCGIPAAEVPTAFLRHATSKIYTAEDLFALTSLGFRGEALSSIASIARVELITKTADAETGTRYVIEGGEEKANEAVGAPDGTTFYVRELFYNTPVRRNFLKSPQAEASYVITLMEQLCLSRPGISMRLIVNGQTKLQTAGSYSMKEVLFTLYGRETVSLMRPLSYEEKDIRVEGYVGLPTLSRGSRAGELTFINGRFIKSPLVMKAVEQAYHGLTMQHKFPMAILQLTMDAGLLDVNVHPTKMEVRFRREKDVFDAVYHAVRETIFSGDLIPEVKAEPEKQPAPKPEEKTAEPDKKEDNPKIEEIIPENKGKAPIEEGTAEKYENDRPAASFRESYGYRVDEDRRLLDRFLSGSEVKSLKESAAPEGPKLTARAEEELKTLREKAAEEENAPAALTPEGQAKPVRPEQLSFFEEKILAPQNEAKLRLIGQLFDTYWLLEYEDQFLLCDQHAAHEKVLYERTMKAMETREHTSQRLDPPLLLTLSGAQSETLSRFMPSFEKLGFAIEPLGGREYGLTAVPDNLFSLSSEELFVTMLDELSEERVTAPEMIDAKVALMSCKAAVKGGNSLSFPEAEALFKELLTLENPYTCPHGRPTMIRMSRRELEKKFKRIV